MEYVALGISILAVAISAGSFWRSRPRAVLDREQKHIINILATRALIVCDQLVTAACISVNGGGHDPYLLHSMRMNARRLEEALDLAFGSGLWVEILGGDSTSGQSVLPYHSVFVQALAKCAADDSTIGDFNAEHLNMGIVRLFRTFNDSELVDRRLKRFIENEIPKAVRNEQNAYSYLARSSEDRVS